MELLLSASLVAAFIAGVAALFAPCCITVLLPAYFASIFRERYKVFLMTGIFFLGILAVFLPIGLGVAAIGGLLNQYHNAIFGIGSIFLIAMGLMLLGGIHVSLPFSIHPSLKKHNVFSVFVLGVFSGIATTCCAPVLAGVLALAALPGSVLWGGLFTLSYVFGMVAPLFLMSLFLDKVDFTGKISALFQKPIQYSIGESQRTITMAEAISGITFLAMGGLTGYLAATNRLFAHSAYQLSVNVFLTNVLDSITGFVKSVPEYAWAALLVATLTFILWLFITQLKKEQYADN